MASIRNSISLTDRMTPTLRSILRSMDSTLRVMKNLDRASNKGTLSKAYRQAEKDIRRANNQLMKMDNYTKMVGSTATKAAGGYGKLSMTIGAVGRGMQALGTSSTFFLQSLASGVYLAQKLGKAINGVMTTSDTARSQVARLGLYNTSKYSNEQLYGKVFDTAMATRSDLTDTADLVNKLLISGVYSGTGAAQSAIGTAGIINKALIAGGGTSEENQRALKQLTQGLASGVLQGDELRSIREQTPYFAQVLAEGLAKVDDRFEGIGIGDLKELGAQGELTADRIVNAMWAMQDEVNKDFEKMPKTFGQAMTSLGNIWEYFLFLLSGADGPLGKINDRLWQFVDYLQSPQGLELLESVAVGINAIASALSWVMGKVGEFVVYLQENAPVAQALFVTLGVVAAAAGLKAAIAWIQACWPILLVAAAVYLGAYAFLEAGYTAEQVAGAIVGGIYWVLAAIWDVIVIIGMVVLWCVVLIGQALVLIGAIVVEAILFIIACLMYIGAAILQLIIWIVAIILLALQGIVQLVVWVVEAIITIIWFLLTVIKTVFLLIETVIRGVIVGIVGAFYGLAQAVLGALSLIAQGIDAIFGSSLADTVGKWSTDLEGTFTTFVKEQGPQKSVEEIGQVWEDFGSGVADMFTNEEVNPMYRMDDTWNATADLSDGLWGAVNKGDNALFGAMDGTWDWTSGALVDMAMFGINGTDFLSGGMLNLGDAYDSGYTAGSNVVGAIGDLTLGAGEVEVTGGYLDGINSDVSLSDEDVQLLRDMAARDYLLQLQTITPVANVSFGDVRETADVNKIVEVIEQMVEEQMATSLVS